MSLFRVHPLALAWLLLAGSSCGTSGPAGGAPDEVELAQWRRPWLVVGDRRLALELPETFGQEQVLLLGKELVPEAEVSSSSPRYVYPSRGALCEDRASDPHIAGLLRPFRQASVEALRAARQPDDIWPDLGLASYLDRLDPNLAEKLGGELLDRLVATTSLEHRRQLGRALLDRVQLLDPVRLGALERDHRLAPRLLALTRSAMEGNRPALREILALALEYPGQAELFDAVIARLFPLVVAEKPPELSRHVLLEELRERFDMLSHDDLAGWRLP